ncbi:hypothetical protein ACS0TY_015584 [Phlomoides rotata]
MASGHGEWWNANVIDVENEAIDIVGAPNISDAYTINGYPRDIYTCSLEVFIFNYRYIHIKSGVRKDIPSTHNQRFARHQLFFMIAKHNVTVVAVDAFYTNMYATEVVLVALG